MQTIQLSLILKWKRYLYKDHLLSFFKDHFVTYCDSFQTDFCNSAFSSSEVFDPLNFALCDIFIWLPSTIDWSKKAHNGYHTAHKVQLFFLYADFLLHKSAIVWIPMEHALERSFLRPFKKLCVVYYQVKNSRLSREFVSLMIGLRETLVSTFPRSVLWTFQSRKGKEHLFSRSKVNWTKWFDRIQMWKMAFHFIYGCRRNEIINVPFPNSSKAWIGDAAKALCSPSSITLFLWTVMMVPFYLTPIYTFK